MNISQTTFTAIDFESAGTATGKTDAPVQIGTCTWNLTGGITDQWMSYIHTDQKITWSAQKVHGITTEHLKDAPKFMMLWPSIKRKLSSRAVVAHGHGTEKRFLSAFPGHGFGPWIDTLQLSRAAFPELESHALGDVCKALELEDQISDLVREKTWHDALYDAVASIALLEKIIEQFDLKEDSIEVLCNPDTSQWRAVRR